MADKYLQLSRDVVDGVRVQRENEKLVVKLNDSQCEVLMMELVQTVKEIIANVASVPHKGRVYQQSCKAVLQELYRVVKDAEAIIHACCDENWVQAAIMLVNIDEVFVDVLFRLDWCTSALGILIKRARSGPSSELQHVPENIQTFGQVEQARAKMEKIHQMLSGHALEDRRTLRRRLQGLQKDTGAPDEQEIVAKLLKFTDPVANMLQDEMALASSVLSVTTGAITRPWIADAAMGVVSGMGVAVANSVAAFRAKLAVGTWIAPSYRLVDRNLVMMSRMDFPAVSSTVLPGRNWLHSVKSQDLKDQKIISKGVVAEVSEVKWLGRTFARKSFKLISSYKFMLVAEKFARLSHPHVLQVFGHSVEPGWSLSGSLVMELMYGDLKNFGLASRQLLVAVDTMLQIAEGMKYLHEQDIVHGDLSATNILINRVPIPEMEGAGYVQAKVAGFGVSGEPRTGTAGWMAPELFEEQNSRPNQEQFKASDIYSYAVTCFEILTSESPFAEAKNQAEVRAAVKAGVRPHLPDSLPTSLQSLIRRCWDADARRRPSFSEICAELRQCKCDLMLNGDATLVEGEKGQLGGHVSKNEQAVGQIGETPSITIGWRIASEENAVELFFPSAQSMSRIVGVGLEFAKVVMSLSNLEVKIVGIGQKSWEAVLPKLTTVDKKLEVVSIATANMRGSGSHKNPTFNEILTGKKSAQKYGVGLCSGNTVHVQSTDVPHEFDYCMVLRELVDYLMLMNVDLAKIGNQCAGGDGAGSSSSGGNKSNQANRGDAQIRQNTPYFTSWWSKGKSKSNTDDDEDDDISPSKRQPQEEEDESAQKKKCEITVLPGPGGSFWNTEDKELHEAPARLNDASIDAELAFEFDMNGKFGKQISVTTTTTFDLGNSAPRRPFRDSFGWYHNPLMTSLKNQPRDARLQHSDLVMGNTKDGKLVLRQTQTCSNNDALGMGVDAQIGFQDTHIGVSFTKNRTTGKTFAREEAYENCTSSDVWRGFLYQDLSAKKRSSAEYEFTCNLPRPVPLAVLEDSNEKFKYLGSGMCGKIEPTFVGVWGIKPEDTNTASKYVFDAQRTLNELSKINGETICSEITQKYHVPMFVNHAMDHLHNAKDNELLGQRESLPGVMRVGLVGI